VDELVEAAEHSGYWKQSSIKSVSYKDLSWKPLPGEYPAIDVSSAKPIFFCGVLTRLDKEEIRKAGISDQISHRVRAAQDAAERNKAVQGWPCTA
jgi:hypothetical protein